LRFAADRGLSSGNQEVASTSQVTRVIPVSRQAATKHLLLLEAVGLVSKDRRGRERIWRLRLEAFADASDRGRSVMPRVSSGANCCSVETVT
jgi:DNA-binding transcriptional ArsR family regulator